MEKPCVFYEISELADRRWSLTEKDIFHSAIKEELRLAIYWDGSYFEGNNLGTYLNQYVFLKPEHIQGLLSGYHSSLDGGVEISEAKTEDGREVILVRQPSRTLDKNYDEIKDRESSWIVPIISKDKIIILSKEVKRYETLHPDILNLHKPDKENNRLSTPNETKYQNTLLKIIGGFLKTTYLSENRAKKAYTNEKGNPNVSAIATKFLNDLSEAGFNHTGIKDRTIRKVFPEALEQIMENIKDEE